MKNTYYAATSETLNNVSAFAKFKARFHIKYLFKNTGKIRIDDNGICFEGWKTISWDEVKDVEMKNDSLMSSRMLATQSRLYMAKSAKPIILHTKDNECIYFYVDWSIATGLSANKEIFSDIKAHIA